MKLMHLFSQCPPAGVVRIDSIWRHPNADTLDIAYVHGTMPCVVKRGSFDEGDLAVYIPAGSMVYTDHEPFKFLPNDKRKDKRHRVRAIRIRGFLSMGLLMEVPAELKGDIREGQDVSAYMQVQKAPAVKAEVEDFKTTKEKIQEMLAEREIRARVIFTSSLILFAVMALLFISLVVYSYASR